MKKLKRFKGPLLILLILSFLAAGLSVGVTWFLGKYNSYSPSYYETKDLDRK
jgi:hypothetical protein